MIIKYALSRQGNYKILRSLNLNGLRDGEVDMLYPVVFVPRKEDNFTLFTYTTYTYLF